MSLRSRIAKLEVGLGSDRDLRAAEELLHRCAAVRVAAMFGADRDPDEVAWARMAEKSGRIAAAADFVRRYRRVRGVDIDDRYREADAENVAHPAELHRGAHRDRVDDLGAGARSRPADAIQFVGPSKDP